ncbi:hypothetical protein M406DRAFT_332007 [Cryphonectria parasitica EP155]|uniref:Retrotransposon gag domain-containing protein n=1 Tax=Cryphonectria parasitica (strain ATCC 38755 / EP155) TaxID=660469 RepID=A0A9P4XZ01_CRYP1|nr:uncharacterized protein M406DRAFT_333204 [Cryphonectria parasitica EP155]XP_040774457.1 uncharacterized protein M406DRAFT_332007 [Cryphonectria parasitica EP155]KAF3762838.1 hypothetical protein M406DRAFT_333204 [Cryphonectria parasitica EP155]KAF3763496.1 hypothetical protein M406DRAFT_332007 [Cryphonectria parasitica EP155]
MAPVTRSGSAAPERQPQRAGDSDPSQTLSQLPSQTLPPSSNPGPAHENPSLEAPADMAGLQRQERELDRQLEEEEIRQRLRSKRARLTLLQSGDTGPEPRPAGLSPLSTPPVPTPSEAPSTAPAQLYRGLPALIYKGGSYMELKTFLYDLRYHFDICRLTNEADKVGYAVRCLKDDPKRDWVNYVARQEEGQREPVPITFGELESFLENQLADPTTRAVTAAATLASIAQGKGESVISFVRRYQEAELESPYPDTEQHRITAVLTRLRPEIRIAISAQTTLPSSWNALIGLARHRPFC